MTTKTELIKQLKAENPKMVKTINDEEIELSKEEYDLAAEKWADMRLEQIAQEKINNDKLTAKGELLTKLGITAEEAALLLS